MKGITGELALRRILAQTPGYWKLLTNLYVPKEQRAMDPSPAQTSEIDAVLVHETGIYVFEMKNYSGWIFGRWSDEQWTQTIKTGSGRIVKTRFRNPLKQYETHMYWLSRYLQTACGTLSFSDGTVCSGALPGGRGWNLWL